MEAKLKTKRAALKQQVTIILDDLAYYSQHKNIIEWYVKARELHTLCTLIDFIEELLEY